MKSRRILLSALSVASLGIILGGILTPASAYSANATPTSSSPLSLGVIPTSPKQGETISILPEGSQKYWAMNDLVSSFPKRLQEIASITPYNDECANWLNYSSIGSTPNKTILYGLYDKFDFYHPTNNYLSWKSNLSDVKNYHVIVSQDSKMATIEREYLLANDADHVTVDNLYTGTTYYWQVNAIKNDDSVVYSDIFTFDVASSTRTLNIEGVSNTRDLGGYKGVDAQGNSRRTLQGMLYRGAMLDDASENGINEIKNGLKIKTDLDLRDTAAEKQNPINMPIYYDYSAPFQLALGVEFGHDSSYINCFDEGVSLVPNVGLAIKQLADINNYPVYFHCSVGRDRTGFIGFLVNVLCGLSKEDIYKEYMYSLFSTTGSFEHYKCDFYTRLNNFYDYFEKYYTGKTFRDKVINYLVTRAGVTTTDCENVRNIMFGDPVVQPKENENGYESCSRVVFKQYGKDDVIYMVPNGSKLDKPVILEQGSWYNGNALWDFANDVVTADMVLNFKDNNEHHVTIHFSGIERLDETIVANEGDVISFSKYVTGGSELIVKDDQLNTYVDSYTVGNKDVTLNFYYKNGVGPASESDKAKIIVMSGQSNGAGVGRYQCLKRTAPSYKLQEYAEGYDNVIIHGWSHYMPLDGFNPVAVDSTYNSISGFRGSFGFELGLAEALSDYYQDETIYIVKTAMGSAYMDSDFRSPSATTPQIITGTVGGFESYTGWLYDKLLVNIQETIDYLEEKGKVPSIEAFMWMQGESDTAWEEDLANQYGDTFTAFMNDWTGHFQKYMADDFITIDASINEIATVGERQAWQHAQEVNACKRAYATAHGGVYLDLNDWTSTAYTSMFEPGKGNYNSNTSTYEIDYAHFDATSYLDMGHSFATSYIKHKDPTYEQNALRIGSVADLTASVSGGKKYIPNFTTTYNGTTVRPYYSFETADCNIATVDQYGKITPIKAGTTQMRISVSYKNEVNVKVVKLTVSA